MGGGGDVPILKIKVDHSLGKVDWMAAFTSAMEMEWWCCASFLCSASNSFFYILAFSFFLFFLVRLLCGCFLRCDLNQQIYLKDT